MEFFAGDDVLITFFVETSAGAPKDLVGASLEFAIGYPGAPRLEIESPDPAIVWAAPASGQVQILLSSEQTQSLAPGRRDFRGEYQLRITDALAIGSTTVVGDVFCKASIVR